MKLILSGGGNPEEVEHLIKILIESMPNKKILYIPIARKRSKDYSKCGAWFSSVFDKYGLEIETWYEFDEKKFDKLQGFGAVYIGGGNTFDLLYDVRESGFDSFLLWYIKSGGIVFGSSAGAIIFGQDIKLSEVGDKNKMRMSDTKGFGFLKGNSLWCHYSERDDGKIGPYVGNGPIIALSNDSGIIVSGKKIDIVGDGVYQFTSSEKKKLGKSL